MSRNIYVFFTHAYFAPILPHNFRRVNTCAKVFSSFLNPMSLILRWFFTFERLLCLMIRGLRGRVTLSAKVRKLSIKMKYKSGLSARLGI